MNNIREARTHHRWTVHDLARAVPCDTKTIHRYEDLQARGEPIPPGAIASRLDTILGTTLADSALSDEQRIAKYVPKLLDAALKARAIMPTTTLEQTEWHAETRKLLERIQG